MIGPLHSLPLIERLPDGSVRVAQAQDHIGGISQSLLKKGERALPSWQASGSVEFKLDVQHDD